MLRLPTSMVVGTCVVLCWIAHCSRSQAATVQDSAFAVETVHVGGGMVPVVFGPEGRLYVGEKQGTIIFLKPNPASPGDFLPAQTLTTLSSANFENERGLLGLEIHPDFANNRWLYAFYSTAEDQRLVRLTLDASFEGVVGSPEILLDGLPNVFANHNAGDIRFSPADGHLYVALGDDAHDFLVEFMDEYHGKILRVDENGLGLTTNPFYNGNLDSVESRTWGIGVRNPFRFTFHPVTNISTLR